MKIHIIFSSPIGKELYSAAAAPCSNITLFNDSPLLYRSKLYRIVEE